MSKGFCGNYGIHNRSTNSWHTLQRVDLIPLPQNVTGLNDLLQINKITKKQRYVTSILCPKRHSGFLILLNHSVWGSQLPVIRTLEQLCGEIHVAKNWGLQSAATVGVPGMQPPAPVQPSDDATWLPSWQTDRKPLGLPWVRATQQAAPGLLRAAWGNKGLF